MLADLHEADGLGHKETIATMEKMTENAV